MVSNSYFSLFFQFTIQGRWNVSNFEGSVLKEVHLVFFPFVSDKAKFKRAHWPIGSDVPSSNTPMYKMALHPHAHRKNVAE